MATSLATQQFVPIEDVRDGIAVLKDGSLRAIVMASSVNFALKSADEQESILLQFQNFLNALDFSVQFFIQSRRLDIRPYLGVLEGQYVKQESDLMKIQVREYIEFIKGFTESTEIMTKHFFVVIPYTPPMLNVSKGIGGIFGGSRETQTAQQTFEEHRTQLEQRIAVVEQGLARTGVRTALLGTEEVIELYYKLFNPGELEKPMPFNAT